MSRTYVATVLSWIALVGTVVGGLGTYRFYLTAPELRQPAIEARWQLVPFVIVALGLVALLLSRQRSGPPGTA